MIKPELNMSMSSQALSCPGLYPSISARFRQPSLRWFSPLAILRGNTQKWYLKRSALKIKKLIYMYIYISSKNQDQLQVWQEPKGKGFLPKGWKLHRAISNRLQLTRSVHPLAKLTGQNIRPKWSSNFGFAIITYLAKGITIFVWIGKIMCSQKIMSA